MGRKSRAKAEVRDPAPAVTAVVSMWTERDWWVIGALLVLTLLVFGQIAGHSFLNYDDGQFIYENEAVKSGLNATSIGWALTSASIGWYPLTWMSHELDVQLWGLKPAGHLMTQFLLHAANAVILFLALRRLTGSTIRGGFVAALFAIHPLHVESVAWASERKDTLSTLFAMLALYVYAAPRRRPVLVAVLFAASLMSKQMYVTLPFLFIVLDWWPLRRGVRVAEKIPLVALSIIASLIAFIGQRNLKALQSVSALPISTRLANALDGYLRYLGKLFWPSRLAVPYPMVDVPSGEVLFAAIVLIAVTAAAWFLRNRAPYFLAGWLWFLGVLVPVIGIIQIGPQSIADRYTYFSYIGLFIAIVWAAADLLPARVAMAIGAIVVLIFTAIAWKQTRYWKDSETLFTHTVEVTPPNPLAEYSIGQALQLSAPERAVPHLERAVMLVQDSLRTHPNFPAPDWYAQSYVAMATAKMLKARAAAMPERAPLLDGAEHDLHQALKIDPQAAHAENNLKVAAQMRRQLLPQGADINALLTSGTVLSQEAKYDEAVAQFRKATELAPQSVEAHVYLGLGLVQAKKNSEAVVAFRAAERLDAARANDYVTRALQLPPHPTNLRDLIASLGRGSS
jgi:tetratricopeptide (TPR) repeat protein